MFQEHKFKIVRHAIKNIWLLIFPVLRAVRSFTLDFDAFYNWITGVWIDVFVILVIIGFGYFRWTFTWCRPGNHHIRLNTGIFIKTETAIAYDKISAVTTEYPFWLRPFKAARIRIKTRARKLGSGDMTLVVRYRELDRLYRAIPITRHETSGPSEIRLPKEEKIKQKALRRNPKWYEMLIYSFAFSSSLSGVIYLSALIFNAGRLISEPARENMDNVYKIANDMSENVSEKIPISIPPFIMILLLILAATWLFSFVSNLLRYCGFSIKKDDASLSIRTGVLTKRIFHIDIKKINYIDVRQNFLMKIFHVGSVNINCSGYGTSPFEHPVILPMLTRSKINTLLRQLGMEKQISDREIKPENLAFWSYISIPFYLLSLMLTADFIAAKMFPDIAHIIMFIALMEVIPMVWFMIVKTLAFFTTGIAPKENYSCVRYSRFLVFHILLVDNDRVVKTQIFQDAIDEKINRARLDLYFTSEKPMANKIKGLNVRDAKYIIKVFEQAAKK